MTSIALYSQTFPTDSTGHFSVEDFKAIAGSVTPTEKIIFYIASLHFGHAKDGQCYLHLNDTDVKDLDYFFEKLATLQKGSVEFRVMLGGAGGAYSALFSDYDKFMEILINFLNKYRFISGIDLDIEEQLHDNCKEALEKVKGIISDISKRIQRGFSITLAPVASALSSRDAIGMGGFKYWDLKMSNEWDLIEGLNVQAYGNYNSATFNQILSTGYKAQQIRMGMLGNDFQTSNVFEKAVNCVEEIKVAHPTFLGTILWETGDTKITPSLWAHAMSRVLRDADTEQNFNREIGWGLFNL